MNKTAESPERIDQLPQKVVRHEVDSDAIRTRIRSLGWRLLEVPVKKMNEQSRQLVVVRWRVVASRGDRSIEMSGGTIDEALRNIGTMLGVLPKRN